MVWLGILWLICLTVVLVEALRAPILPPVPDDRDPNEDQEGSHTNSKSENFDNHNPHP
jgi:hypothetical protein